MGLVKDLVIMRLGFADVGHERDTLCEASFPPQNLVNEAEWSFHLLVVFLLFEDRRSVPLHDSITLYLQISILLRSLRPVAAALFFGDRVPSYPVSA